MNVRLSNFQTKQVDLQLTTDTVAYISGDVLVATVAVPMFGATPPDPTRVKIESIEIIDKDAQSGAFDIVFLDDNKSLGTINAAVSITDADSLFVSGIIPVTASSYTALTAGGQAVAQPVLANPVFVQTQAGSSNIYVGLISRDTKTYTASALYLRLSVQYVSNVL